MAQLTACLLLMIMQIFPTIIAAPLPADLQPLTLNNNSVPSPTLSTVSHDASRYIPSDRLPPWDLYLTANDFDGSGDRPVMRFSGYGAAFNTSTFQRAVQEAGWDAYGPHNRAKTQIPIPPNHGSIVYHSDVDGSGDLEITPYKGLTWYNLNQMASMMGTFRNMYTWEGKIPGFQFTVYPARGQLPIGLGSFFDEPMPKANA